MPDKDNLDRFLKNIKEKEKEKYYRIFVEIGPGSLAIPVNKKGRFFEDNEIYIGIDKDMQGLIDSKLLSHYLKKKLEKLGKYKNKNIFFLNGLAEKLPFENNFVDEIFLGNIVGCPKISLKALERILKETERVLKENGILIIKENISPFEFDELNKLFRKLNLNFQLKEIYTLRDKSFNKEFLKYEDIKLAMIALDSYIAYFLKKKNNN